MKSIATTTTAFPIWWRVPWEASGYCHCMPLWHPLWPFTLPNKERSKGVVNIANISRNSIKSHMWWQRPESDIARAVDTVFVVLVNMQEAWMVVPSPKTRATSLYQSSFTWMLGVKHANIHGSGIHGGQQHAQGTQTNTSKAQQDSYFDAFSDGFYL